MANSTEVKRRRVMQRDHEAIANYITEELARRRSSEFRRLHEARWHEVDRQIAMDPPETIVEDGREQDWHNAIQLGDLSDASEIFTADVQRLVFPNDRRFFAPHVELPTDVDAEGEPVPAAPERQRKANGVLRSLMSQQHKDFGLRGRSKLAVKEVFHHGSVVAEVRMERLEKHFAGGRVEQLRAPIPVVHSMWNCYPDPSPTIQGTELFYRGSMIIVSYVPLPVALDNPNWINKDKLREAHRDAQNNQISNHIEIVRYFGDIFLKRHDGNLLFPNRETTISNNVFLESRENVTPYSPILYTGYERDDVRDPYYTSPVVKLAPMAKFTTHMANKTMDAVDLGVDPPLNYDSMDNTLRSNPPEIHPGARIGTRGGLNVNALTGLGDAQLGLAAMQFGKQSIQESTGVDALRKGVTRSVEQTATEVVKSEQRSETRTVEFVSSYETGFVEPYLHMQHDFNLMDLRNYPFYNDEIHTPDFLRADRGDLPRSVIFEVVGSRQLLGEEARTARFINTVNIVAQLSPTTPIGQRTDWDEVLRQLWEDTRVKDPERFIMLSDRNAETAVALQEQQAAFEQQLVALQQQMQQLTEQAASAEQKAAEASLQEGRARLETERARLETRGVQERLRIEQERERAAKELERIREQIEDAQRGIERQQLVAAAERPAPEPAPAEPREQNINVGTVVGGDKEVRLIENDRGKVVGAKIVNISDVKVSGGEEG